MGNLTLEDLEGEDRGEWLIKTAMEDRETTHSADYLEGEVNPGESEASSESEEEEEPMWVLGRRGLALLLLKLTAMRHSVWR